MDLQKVLTQLNTLMTDAEVGEVIGAQQSIVNRLRKGVHKTSYYERVKAIKELAESKGIICD